MGTLYIYTISQYRMTTIFINIQYLRAVKTAFRAEKKKIRNLINKKKTLKTLLIRKFVEIYNN